MPFTEPITDRDYWQKRYESMYADNIRLREALRLAKSDMYTAIHHITTELKE